MKSIISGLLCPFLLISVAEAKTLAGGLIDHDTVWTAVGSPYEVASMTVAADVTLTIEPGVIVQVHDYATIDLHGRMVVGASGGAPVRFTSLSGVTEGNPWRCIRVTNGGGEGNGLPSSQFQNCIFEGGGQHYSCMLEVWAGAWVTLDGCTFQHSAADGIRFHETSEGTVTNSMFANNAWTGIWMRGSSPHIEGCVFRGNGNAARLESWDGKGAFPVFRTTTFEGDDRVHIASDIHSGGTWTAAPYFLGGSVSLVSNQTITLEGGSSIAFADFASLTIQGNFIAAGTAEAPILFTSSSGVGIENPWRAIRLANGQGEGNGLPGSRLSYCTFEGGGQHYGCMLEVAKNSDITLDHCTFRQSSEDGARFYEHVTGAVTDTVFQQNGRYGLWLRASSPDVTGCQFSGNGYAGKLESWDGKGSFPRIRDTLFEGGNRILINSDIHSGGVLTAAPYFLYGSVTGTSSETITIEGGSHFLCDDFSSLTLHGNLMATGTAASPIIFTSASGVGEDNPWRAVRLLRPSESGQELPASKLDYCTFEGGGQHYGCMLEAWIDNIELNNCHFRHSSIDGVRLYDGVRGSVTATTFEGNARYGLFLRGSSPEVTGCRFANNGHAGKLESGEGKGSYPFIRHSVFEGGDRFLINSDMHSGGTLTAAPYHLSGSVSSTADETLTIEGGSTFVCDDFTALIVEGNLIADGTAGAPILFTSESGVTEGNQWRAVRLTNSGGEGNGLPGNRLSYCTFEGGGQHYNCMLEAWAGKSTILDHCHFRHSVVDGARIYDGSGESITHSVFEDIAGYGLRLQGTSPNMTENIFRRCGSQAILLLSTPEGGNSAPVFANNTFGDDDHVEIGSDLHGDSHFTNPGQAYWINGTKSIHEEADVSIAAGATVEFAPYGALAVSGSLKAEGTGGQPIRFTSDQAAKDREQWRALVFDSFRTKPSALKHCTVEAGGQHHGALVRVEGAPLVTISDSELRLGQGHGILVTSGAQASVSKTSISDCSRHGISVDTGAVPVDSCEIYQNGESGIYTNSAAISITGSTLRGNAHAGLHAYGEVTPTITECSITENGEYGVRNQVRVDLSAKNNWWGHASGPQHEEKNPGGQGQLVTDY